MSDSPAWRATIRIRRPTPADAERLARTLAPEVSREVPRARAELRQADARFVELLITAADTSACRAALNTYLAWVSLVLSTEQVARASGTASRSAE